MSRILTTFLSITIFVSQSLCSGVAIAWSFQGEDRPIRPAQNDSCHSATATSTQHLPKDNNNSSCCTSDPNDCCCSHTKGRNNSTPSAFEFEPNDQPQISVIQNCSCPADETLQKASTIYTFSQREQIRKKSTRFDFPSLCSALKEKTNQLRWFKQSLLRHNSIPLYLRNCILRC